MAKLEEVNESYKKAKASLEKANQELEGYKAQSEKLYGDKTIQSARVISAERAGNKAEAEAARTEMKKIDEEIKKIKKLTEDKTAEILQCRSKINERIDSIKGNPEMKKHLDTVLAKQYDRKIAKLEKEKAEVSDKKARLTNLQTLVTKSPALANNLKGILVAKKKIEDLNAELKVLTNEDGSFKDPARVNEIKNKELPDAQDKMSVNKTPLLEYIKKNGLDIKEEDIDGLTAVMDNNGNLDLTTTMAHNMGKVDRQLRGIEKNIRYHISARNEIPVPFRTQSNPDQQQPSNGQGQTRGDSEEESEEKPKWYQFGKRFRAWNEKRKQKALPDAEGEGHEQPEGEGQPGGQTSQEGQTQQEERNHFRDSLKYEIVRDAADSMRREGLRDAKSQERRQTQSPEHEDDGGREPSDD